MTDQRQHRGTLEGKDVKRGEMPLDFGGRAQLFLRADESRVITDAKWEAPPSIGADHPLAACLDELCMNAEGVELALFLRLDDYQLLAGVPKELARTPEATLATRVFRSAFSQFRPGARGPGYLSSGLLLLRLPRGARAELTEPGSYFLHHYRRELWADAAAEASRGGPLSPRAACAYVDALASQCEEPLELDWPVEEGTASWKWLTTVCLPEAAGSAERARQLLEGGYGGAKGSGSFQFGHLDGGPWRAPTELEIPEDADHAEFILDDLADQLSELPEDGVLIAAPRWMAVGQTFDSPSVRRADISHEEMSMARRPGPSSSDDDSDD